MDNQTMKETYPPFQPNFSFPIEDTHKFHQGVSLVLTEYLLMSFIILSFTDMNVLFLFHFWSIWKAGGITDFEISSLFVLNF